MFILRCSVFAILFTLISPMPLISEKKYLIINSDILSIIYQVKLIIIYTMMICISSINAHSVYIYMHIPNTRYVS